MRLQLSIGLGLLVALLMGCSAPMVDLQITRPAEYAIPNINDVAIGQFELVEVNIQTWDERKGKWSKQTVAIGPAEMQSIQKQLRNQLLRRLQNSPSFTLYFLDELEQIQNDQELQALIQAAEGTRIQEMDAVIHGKVWLNLILSQGADIGKAELVYQNPAGGLQLKIETLASWPYQSVRGTISSDLKLTQINPTNIVASVFNQSRYVQKIGGYKNDQAQQIPATIEQVINRLAEQVADEFTKKIAIYTELEQREIDPDGDLKARQLLQAGAFEEAIRKLEGLTGDNPLSADLYNLGIGYEAADEQRLAWLVYGEALRLDLSNELYAGAVGRIEEAIRANTRLQQQLAGN